MKLFVVVKDNHILHLKKESSWASLGESGNWILKKNKSLNAYSISLGNARTKIQLSSERSKSNLSFEPKNVCIAWKMCELCVFEDEAIFWKSPNPQVLPMRHSWPLCDARNALAQYAREKNIFKIFMISFILFYHLIYYQHIYFFREN